ncbi:MAG TPA: Ku protein [Rubrivivax sp.]|nr:Ku protein [Rubrivivax sp.]
MATRIIWKGAISFGLVHVPVALLPASTSAGIDFDWLDKRTLDPVGYKRVNKRTGKEIDKEHIVKGVKVEDGRYVVISEDEIKAAYPKTTQTIEIEGFVKAPEVPFTYLEAPYYLEPLARGEKVYALLREAMLDAGVIGIARVVMHSKEHLAALVPTGPALMLNTLRWAEEIRPAEGLKLPPEGKTAAGLKDAELKMARQLVDDMTGKFEPDRYTDKFAGAVHALIKQRVAAGETSTVQPLEEAAGAAATNVVDLTELLARSLGKRKPAAANDAPARPAKKVSAPRKTAAAKKRAA